MSKQHILEDKVYRTQTKYLRSTVLILGVLEQTMSPLKIPQDCTILTFFLPTPRSLTPLAPRTFGIYSGLEGSSSRGSSVVAGHAEQSPVKLNNPDGLCPENLPLGKHLCVPQDNPGREAKNAKLSTKPHLQERGRLHPRHHLRLAAGPGWPRMNIKVKLPFLFTFLQLRGATCSGTDSAY